MKQNSQRSQERAMENIVSSASARGEVLSQGTTGLLNIIDQNFVQQQHTSSHNNSKAPGDNQ